MKISKKEWDKEHPYEYYIVEDNPFTGFKYYVGDVLVEAQRALIEKGNLQPEKKFNLYQAAK